MEEKELIPGLFRKEYQNIVSVLYRLFGMEHIENAEDIVSDTFLAATEVWSLKGVPENPTGWLYAVAKNKTRNFLKRNRLFEQKLSAEIKYETAGSEEIDIDLSPKNISDSQLAMIFTTCNPCNSVQTQIALALNLLCGFGIPEIADAFLTNKEVIYKRINRGKEKLRESKIKIEEPSIKEINDRLNSVLTTLYLLFSEGYYSTSHISILREEFCWQAIRLTGLLIKNQNTNKPAASALLSLMCFHASRLAARTTENGEAILYEDQDEKLWNRALIDEGIHHLNHAAAGSQLTRFHLEAGIAYWHTIKEDTPEKWEEILQLYNHLLILEYSPVAALNRTFALSRVKGKQAAIAEAEKLKLNDNHFYFSLLGHLYSGIDNKKALQHFQTALNLSKSEKDRATISKNMDRLHASSSSI